MNILLVIGIFVLLVVVHELGHFFAAKMFRVRVEEFGVGYPPRAFIFGKWGGTEYTLNWLPLGGFVRLYGDSGSNETGKGAYAKAPRIVQAIILVAGVTANAVLAWALFAGAYVAGVPAVVETREKGVPTQLFVADVVPASPASVAGMAAGDEIIGIADPKGMEVTDLSPTGVISFVKARGGQALLVTVLHAHATSTLTIHPANAVVPGAAGRPALGVGLVLVAERSLPWSEAFTKSFSTTYEAFVTTAGSLWAIILTSLEGAPNLSDIVGPIGLVGIVGSAAQNGFGNVLRLAAFISVNLAIINLVPIPVLDGGRLFVLGIEALFRRSAPKLFVQSLNLIGIGLVAVLMITVSYHDIVRLFV